jgi:hypothetical protein
VLLLHESMERRGRMGEQSLKTAAAVRCCYLCIVHGCDGHGLEGAVVVVVFAQFAAARRGILGGLSVQSSSFTRLLM